MDRLARLRANLIDYSKFPTSVPGVLPIWHLGALSVLRETERLEAYLASMKAGDGVGFALM